MWSQIVWIYDVLVLDTVERSFITCFFRSAIYSLMYSNEHFLDGILKGSFL